MKELKILKSEKFDMEVSKGWTCLYDCPSIDGPWNAFLSSKE